MSRTLVAAISGLVCTFITYVVADGPASVARVAAQVNPESLVAIDVRARNNATERCFEVRVLQERVAHYGAGRLGRASELRLELDLDARDSAELRVYRGSALVSRRRFNGLPETCADRRDAVALSIALALESVIRDLAPASESNDASAESTTTSSSSSSGSRTSSSEADASAVTAEPRESEIRTGEARTDPRADAPRKIETRAPPPSAAPPVAKPDAEPEREDDADGEEIETTPPADESASTLSIRLHLGARLVAAALPAPVFAGVLGGELWVDRTFGLDFSAFATAVDTSPFSEGRVRSRLVGGEVLGCYSVGLSGFAAQGCAGILAAACQAQGRDYPRAFPAATLGWAAGTARLAVAWPAQESVSLRLVIQGHANFVRPVLRVDGVQDDLSPYWLGGSAGLDLVVSFD